MNLFEYSEIVSPFLQGKILYHSEKLMELGKTNVVTPITCEIDLTDGACNNKCKYCFFNNNSYKKLEIINKGKLFELLLDLKRLGIKAIELAGGGEPTMHPDFQEIIDFIDDCGFKFGLVTNGLLLGNYNINKRNLEFIRISLDAATSETYFKVHGVHSFDKVINNIRYLINYIDYKKIGIGFLIVPENVHDIPASATLACDLGCRFIQFRPASIIDDVDKTTWNQAIRLIAQEKVAGHTCQIFGGGIKWDNIIKGRNYNKCYTSTLVAVIKANGDIPLCILNRNNSNKILGNINEMKFEDIWFSELHNNLITNIDLQHCRKPCKHDVYNILVEALKDDYLHINFV